MMKPDMANRLGLSLMLDADKPLEENIGQGLLVDMHYDMGLKDDPEEGTAPFITLGAWPMQHMMENREDYD